MYLSDPPQSPPATHPTRVLNRSLSSSLHSGESEGEPSSGRGRAHAQTRQRFSFVGTPDYLAPEVLLGKGHGQPVDWWALGKIVFTSDCYHCCCCFANAHHARPGIIIFEFLTGIPPFNDESPGKIFENILEHKITWPSIPDEMSNEAAMLIRALLNPDPAARLGTKSADDVKRHPFFRGVNWESALHQTPAFIPKPNMEYHDDQRRGSVQHPDDEVVEDTAQKLDRRHFINFSYVSLPALESLNRDAATKARTSQSGSGSSTNLASGV